LRPKGVAAYRETKFIPVVTSELTTGRLQLARRVDQPVLQMHICVKNKRHEKRNLHHLSNPAGLFIKTAGTGNKKRQC
jgi:hypothetical protein